MWDVQHFLKGTEFLRFLLTSAEAAPCVPGLALQGLLLAGASISINALQRPQETSQSAHGARGDPSSPHAPRRAPRAEPASHISLCWASSAWGRRAGGGVMWRDSFCAPETQAGSIISFAVYLFTSSFQKLYKALVCSEKFTSWKKNKNKIKTNKHQPKHLLWRQLPGSLIPASKLSISYLHLLNFFWISSFHSKVRKILSKSGETGTWRDHVFAWHLISANFKEIKHIFTYPTGPV